MTTIAKDFAMIAAGTLYFVLAYYLTVSEMTELFSIERMNRVNAKFDRDKLLAFNTDVNEMMLNLV